MPHSPPHCRPAISTQSLGYATHHTLPEKLLQAARHGFEGIELYFDDLETHAQTHHGGITSACLHGAAKAIAALCESLRLDIVCLQPLRHFEGHRDPDARVQAFATAALFISLAQTLGTDLIAASSSFLSRDLTTGSLNVVVSDFRALADMGAVAQPPIRFTYEALSWGTWIDTWEASWAVVRRVDRPNFGLCLDTFNIAGRTWADPSVEGGVRADGDEVLAVSLARIEAELAGRTDKVFYVQAVDAERLARPLAEGHEFWDSAMPPRMMWSRACRLFYGESTFQAYLPIDRVLRVLFGVLGWRGWVSMELFNRDCAMAGQTVAEEHARRGIQSWQRMQDDFPDIVLHGRLAPFADGPGAGAAVACVSTSSTCDCAGSAGQSERIDVFASNL